MIFLQVKKSTSETEFDRPLNRGFSRRCSYFQTHTRVMLSPFAGASPRSRKIVQTISFEQRSKPFQRRFRQILGIDSPGVCGLNAFYFCVNIASPPQPIRANTIHFVLRWFPAPHRTIFDCRDLFAWRVSGTSFAFCSLGWGRAPHIY